MAKNTRVPILTPDWMKLAEAAARLDCHPQTILNRIHSGTITGVRAMRFGRIVRINREDFERFMESITFSSEKSA